MDNRSRGSSNSSTWGVAQLSSTSSDGRTDPEVDLHDEAAASALRASPRTRQELVSQLQGLQQELYRNQELQQALRAQEQHCSGCSGYSVDFNQASAVPWKSFPLGVPAMVQPLQQQLHQQQMQMMQMQQQIEQLQRRVPAQPTVQTQWRPVLLDESGSRPAEDATKKKTVLQPQTPDKPFYNEHGVDLMKLSDFELEKVVPLNANGERTSIGALQHPDKCTRCIFWFRNICEKGIRCEFCHFTHPGQIAKKIRPSKSVRLKQKEQEKKSEM